jgi:anti-sigma regulatory factor (Ser/Thr protein kinase)
MSEASLVLRSDRTELRRLGELAERFGADHHLSDDDVMAINLVLDEVVTNVIEHGYADSGGHKIHVSLALDGAALTIRVEDEGRAFDPTRAPPPDLDRPLEERQVGGLGIHIVRSVMDAVDYERRDGKNVLTMRKTIDRS